MSERVRAVRVGDVVTVKYWDNASCRKVARETMVDEVEMYLEATGVVVKDGKQFLIVRSQRSLPRDNENDSYDILKRCIASVRIWGQVED